MTDRKNQGSLDVDGEDVIDGNTGGQPADRGDDGFKFKAMREAVRQRSDGLIVTSSKIMRNARRRLERANRTRDCH